MFERILVANRGEIAVRVARTCRELGVSCVAVFSDVDVNARHVAVADDAVHLPGVSPGETYLDMDALLGAARHSGAQAIHPGYGFLSENADFAHAVIDAGLTWIGPPPDVTRALGDKIEARRIARSAGVPVVPGGYDAVGDEEALRNVAATIGYPVAVKAAAGGGGRGLKIAPSADEVGEALAAARREAQAYFGSSAVYLERYLEDPKHLEVQILAPNPDEALWLGVRDCSYQRRNQKLVEETPPPRFAERAAEMGAAAVALSKTSGYVNAGTVEFLVDRSGDFFFLEVNARLQVEHTVTEEVFGIDLVAAQLKIAAGDPLGFSQDDLQARGHAIECRINAEDATRGFLPSPGRIDRLVPPGGLGIRFDSGYGTSDVVPSEYDSLIGKLIAWGSDRDEARRRLLRALDEMVVEGVATTIPAHRVLLDDSSFVAGTHTTRTIESGGVLDRLGAGETGRAEEDVLLVGDRPVRLWHAAMAGSAAAAVHAGGAGAAAATASMQGTILKVLVEPGRVVRAGDALVVLEAMKMETTIVARRAGSVADVRVAAGDTVAPGEVVVVVE